MTIPTLCKWESTGSYIKEIGKHSMQALLGYNFSESFNQWSSIENSGFDNDLWLTNNIGYGELLKAGNAEIRSYKKGNRYISFFGRAIYNL